MKRAAFIILLGMGIVSGGFAVPAAAQFEGLVGDRVPCVKPHPLIDVFQDDKQDDRWRDEPLMLWNVVGARASSVLLRRPAAALPAKSTKRIAPVTEFVKETYLESTKIAGIYRAEEERRDSSLGSDSYRAKSGAFGYLPCKKYVESVNFNPKDAKASRALYNYCANQHVLAFRSDPKIIIDWRGKQKNLDPRFCQPLNLVPLPEKEEEYRVEDYLLRGAIRTNVKPREKSKTSIRTLYERQKLKKGYPTISELTCNHPDNEADLIKAEEENGRKWDNPCKPKGDGTFDQGAGSTYERIYDPSHPFSPRYDFEYNEREHYNPLAASYGFGVSEGACAVSCAAVPVDVMRFRAFTFNQGISCRINKNKAAYEAFIVMGLTPDEARKLVPCSTRWDLPDLTPKECNACGTIEQLCQDLRRPLPGLNTLKLRPFNPQNFPYGAAEGMRFKEWFGTNMPYMRWWDTGGQANPSTRAWTGSGSDPQATEGSLDTIVGVGKDGAGGGAKTGRTCRYGGDGIGNITPNSKGFARVRENTSWAELKMYQMNTAMWFKLQCIGRYEKLYKLDSSEDLVLNRLGVEYQKLEDGLIRDQNWPYSWLGYVNARPANESFPIGKKGKPAMTVNLDYALPGDVIVYDDLVFNEFSPVSGFRPRAQARLPLAAYVTETNNQASKNAARKKAAEEGKKAPTEIKCDYIKVVDYNNGKYPDVCGNTDARGFGPERTIFKPGTCVDKEGKPADLPPEIEERFKNKSHLTKTCNDPNLSACVEPLWPHVLVVDILNERFK